MPELPDIAVYIDALEPRVLGQRLNDVRVRSPFLVRTFDPPVEELAGRKVTGLRRIGKRIVFGCEDDLWLVLHLMIAGRLHWKAVRTPLVSKTALAAFEFEAGTLLLTEAGTKKRASLHVVRSEIALAAHDRGGLDVLSASLAAFRGVLTERNHSLKRALCDPTLFDGIGNAYSDEILHRARLSPLALTQTLSLDESERLYHAVLETLVEWITRLRREAGDGFPENVTAFREGMAVHGRYGKPCPECGTVVQRIRYAESETNYCPFCQTGGRILADRSLSRLLKDDWPRTVDDLEG